MTELKYLKEPEHCKSKLCEKIKKIKEKVREKHSHQNKTLLQHIQEIKELGKKFQNLYNFDFEIFEFLAEFHDIGKLHKDWDVNKNNNIKHALYSLLYTYMYFNDILKDKIKYFYILLYLIYRHHSLLTKKSCDYSYFKDQIRLVDIEELLPKDVFENVKNQIKQLSFEEKVKIIDTFGVFKLCDILSAKNLSYEEIEKYFINEINTEILVKEYISKKNMKLDEKKLEIQKELSKYENLILIAPTGWGKTTSSLFFLKNKLFITLPTITAIKKFFSDLSSISQLSDKIDMYFYLYDAYLSFEFDKENENLLNEDRIFSYEFSKMLAKPIMITTADQILLTFLNAGKYYLRRYNFYRASFVLDEIHLLNPSMLYLFLHFYNLYRKIYDLKLLMMSTTLPKHYFDAIKEVDSELGNLICKEFEKIELKEEFEKKRRIMYKYFEVDIKDWIRENLNFFNQNKRFLIILNTVNKAQEVYKLLKENKIDSILLHSRFIVRDRFQIEDNIENYKVIVSTQVTEVSLDISRDFLLTELAPLPALIQRFGRVNRYGNYTNEINVYIFKPEELKEIEKEKRKLYPYSLEEMNYSENVIKELEVEKLSNEYELIKKYYEHSEKLKGYAKEEIKETKKILSKWINEFDYFYTALISPETSLAEIDELFNLRGSTNVFVLLDYRLIEDDETRKEYIKVLDLWEKYKSDFEMRRKLFWKIKEFLIPIPLWIIKKNVESLERIGFPIIFSNILKYSKDYGLIFEDKELQTIYF
ncbi:MAG: CRISPR-associated helicase Cas3' [Candidatus Aenigmatarchaeota archaeon]